MQRPRSRKRQLSFERKRLLYRVPNPRTLMEKITGPLSAGSLRLASTDVRAIARFYYFSNPGDV